MKKTISIILSAILVFSCFGAIGLGSIASATSSPAAWQNTQDDIQAGQVVVLTDDVSITKSFTVKGGGTLVVQPGCNLTIGALTDLENAYNSGTSGNPTGLVTIMVEEDATFIVSKGANVENYGRIIGDGFDTHQIATDQFYNHLYLPDGYNSKANDADQTNPGYSRADGVNWLDAVKDSTTGNPIKALEVVYKYRAICGFDATATTLDDGTVVNADKAYTVWKCYEQSGYASDGQRDVKVRLGDTCYVCCNATDMTLDSQSNYALGFPYTVSATDRKARYIDTSKLKVSANGVWTSAKEHIDTTRGVFAFQPSSEAVVLTVPKQYYRYENVARTFKIDLPQNNGYYVKTQSGAEKEVEVKFGETLSFEVVLNPDYDKSKDNVVVYWGTLKLTPDEYGFYDVTGPIKKKTESGDQAATDSELQSGYYSTEFYYMEPTGGIQQSANISVMGVISNEKQNSLSNAFSTIRQVFQIIKEIFQEIFGMFKNIFGGIGA